MTVRVDHIDVIERSLREKVLPSDFRYPMMDARLALGRLCALQQRYDEAAEWFAQARTVLDEQGARPLRAIVDFDEALMYLRCAAPGDRERAAPLLDVAQKQLQAIGMTGWIKRAEALRAQHAQEPDVSVSTGPAEIPEVASGRDELETRDQELGTNLLRREGEYWTFQYHGAVCRLRDRVGLGYLAVLLERPHEEVPALTLVVGAGAPESEGVPPAERAELNGGWPNDLGEVLAPRARAEYRERLGDLEAQLEEAERDHDAGRAERLRAEREALAEALGATLGLGGRARLIA